MKAIRPSGTGFGYCINCYVGCAHGCKYCYARTASPPRKKYQDWINPKPRHKIVEWLKEDVSNPRNAPEISKIRDIFVGSVCDAYQPLELQHGITREVVKILI